MTAVLAVGGGGGGEGPETKASRGLLGSRTLTRAGEFDCATEGTALVLDVRKSAEEA